MIALTITLAVFVGIAVGLLGGGGSTLTVPPLAFVAGLDARHAITTALLVVGVTSAVGAVAHAPGSDTCSGDIKITAAAVASHRLRAGRWQAGVRGNEDVPAADRAWAAVGTL